MGWEFYVSILIGYGLDKKELVPDRGRDASFTITSRTAVGLTDPPM
jgi:hypothetical protein